MTTSRDRLAPVVAPDADLTFRFSATPHGARLARRLASRQMDAWGWPYGSTANDTVELIAAEPAANAVTHGRVPGRDAELRLRRRDGGCGVRVEVSDTCGERLPVVRGAGGEEDGGRGLVLVAALAEEWGTAPRPGSPGKTVWAVVPTGVPAAPVPCVSPGQDHGGRSAAAEGLAPAGHGDARSGTGP